MMQKYVCLLLLCVAFLLLGIRAPRPQKNEEICKTYLTQLGWETEAQGVSETILLPDANDNNWKNYYAMQAEAGFPLGDFSGKTVLRYTYRILNYPDYSAQSIYANVFMADDKIIGGDIFSTALDGFLRALCPQKKAGMPTPIHNS